MKMIREICFGKDRCLFLGIIFCKFFFFTYSHSMNKPRKLPERQWVFVESQWEEKGVNKKRRLARVRKPKSLNESFCLLQSNVSLMKYCLEKLSILLSPENEQINSYSLVTCILSSCAAVDPRWKDCATYQNKLREYQKIFDPKDKNNQLMIDAYYLNHMLGLLIYKKEKALLLMKSALN